MPDARSRRWAGALIAALLAAVTLPAPGLASDLGVEVGQGRSLAQAVRAGKLGCDELSSDQLEVVGEYAMDRFLGNRSAHAAMNAHMVAMMGEAGERRMHIALGRRYSGCGSVTPYGWMGPMLGMMGARGRGYPPGSAGGMMGGGYGSMMGRNGGRHGHDDDLGIGTALAIALGAALLAGVLVALAMGTRRGRSPHPPAP